MLARVKTRVRVDIIYSHSPFTVATATRHNIVK